MENGFSSVGGGDYFSFMPLRSMASGSRPNCTSMYPDLIQWDFEIYYGLLLHSICHRLNIAYSELTLLVYGYGWMTKIM